MLQRCAIHNLLYVLAKGYWMLQSHTWQPLRMCCQNPIRGQPENSLQQERTHAEWFLTQNAHTGKNEFRCYEAKWKGDSHWESNPGHLWLESPLVCHFQPELQSLSYAWNEHAQLIYITKYTLFYKSPKNWDYYAHAQTVCTRPLLRGEGPGNKLLVSLAEDHLQLEYTVAIHTLSPVGTEDPLLAFPRFLYIFSLAWFWTLELTQGPPLHSIHWICILWLHTCNYYAIVGGLKVKAERACIGKKK